MPLKHIVIRRRPGHRHQAIAAFGHRTVICAIGRSGITATKREGDCATPVGAHRVECLMFRPDCGPRPRSDFPTRPIVPGDGWCDAPEDRNYNRPVRLPYRASHEDLHRSDSLYDRVLVLDWNTAPRRRHRGSAIFVHVARPQFEPTEGCIAFKRSEIDHIIAQLSIKTKIIVL